jgi:hypothetical protein
LQRALVDFAADVSVHRATQKLLEHYGVELSASSIRQLTQQNGGRMFEQQQQLLTQLGPEAGCQQLLTEMDGSMVPLVENSQKSRDKRKNKSLFWGEARLCMAHPLG